MKKNKLNLIILFSIAFSLLAGCGDVDNGVNTVNNEEQAKVSSSQTKTDENHEEDSGGLKEVEIISEPAPKYAYSGVDGKLRRKILSEIRTAREDKYPHKIGEIQSFYCLDNLDFPGFKLNAVEMHSTLFRYGYSPQKGDGGGFQIMVCSPTYELKFDLDGIVGDNTYYTKTKDGFAYSKDGATLRGVIDSNGVAFAIFAPQSFPTEVIEEWHKMRDIMSEEDFQEGLDSIAASQVPEEYGTYEFLRDLAFRVIESAELVTVE